MATKGYKIITPLGGWYEIDTEGRVLACSNGFNKRNASESEKDTWRIIGAISTHSFAGLRVVPIESLVGRTVLHKNGSPMFTCVDIDHGTTRVHGNTKVHGIKSIITL